ncbi:MAG: hypothetical protein ABSH22_15755, partial [Tepidisphaeraceae bacterium]
MKLKKRPTFTVLSALLIAVGRVHAQAPSTAPDFHELVTSSILRDYPRMLHEPTPPLAFPFITPGSVYTNQLWDWDSYFSDV